MDGKDGRVLVGYGKDGYRKWYEESENTTYLASFIGISQLTCQYVKTEDQKITPWMIEIALIGLRRFSPIV